MAGCLKCVVLGANGFIGSHVAEELVARGHDVRAFVRPEADLRNLDGFVNQVELMRGNFFAAADIRAAVAGMDCVVHLVSTTLPKSSNESMAFDVETNVMGHIGMLDAARAAGVGKIVFASSGGTVYGLPQALPLKESHPTTPICSHGIGKRTAEMYLDLYRHLYGLDYVALRFANPYGLRQNPRSGQGVVTAFLWQCLKGEPISIWGDGHVARDFFYVDDLVRAVMTAVEEKTPSHIYNVGSGKPCTLLQLLDVIGRVTERVPDVRFLPGRNFDVPVNYLDIELARKELGWLPTISIEQGIRDTWERLCRSPSGMHT